jgi:hypothetical protein
VRLLRRRDVCAIGDDVEEVGVEQAGDIAFVLFNLLEGFSGFVLAVKGFLALGRRGECR